LAIHIPFFLICIWCFLEEEEWLEFEKIKFLNKKSQFLANNLQGEAIKSWTST